MASRGKKRARKSKKRKKQPKITKKSVSMPKDVTTEPAPYWKRLIGGPAGVVQMAVLTAGIVGFYVFTPYGQCISQKIATDPVQDSPTYETIEKPAIEAARTQFHPDRHDTITAAPFRTTTGARCDQKNAYNDTRYSSLAHIGICPGWYEGNVHQRIQTIGHEYLHWLDDNDPAVSSKGFYKVYLDWQKHVKQNDVNYPLTLLTTSRIKAAQKYNPKKIEKEAFAYVGAEVMFQKRSRAQHAMICEMTNAVFAYYENVFHPDIVALRDNCETTGPKYTIKNPKPYEVHK